MKKGISTGLMALLMVLCLLVSSFGTALFMPEKEVEVVKLVESECEYSEYEFEVIEKDYLTEAKDAWLKAIEDEEDEADNSVEVLGNYYFDEMKERKLYDDYVVSFDGEDYSVEFEMKLKLKEEDEPSEYRRYKVKYIVEVDEDSEIEYELLE